MWTFGGKMNKKQGHINGGGKRMLQHELESLRGQRAHVEEFHAWKELFCVMIQQEKSHQEVLVAAFIYDQQQLWQPEALSYSYVVDITRLQ